MPRCSALWMAAGLLWILDSSINISMEPFRAFVADLLPEEQRTQGFAMQSLFIGLGAVVASALPWLLTNVFHLAAETSQHAIPLTVRLSFYIGAAAFFGAVLWTILTTKEYPPEDLEAFRRKKAEHRGIGSQRIGDLRRHPRHAADHAAVGSGAVTHLAGTVLHVAVLPGGGGAQRVWRGRPELADLYAGVEWGGICFGMYSAVCFVFSFFLPKLAKAIGAQTCTQPVPAVRRAGLAVGGRDPRQESSAAVDGRRGNRVGQHASMPYAVLAGSLPAEQTGVYMGIFNFFIVLPEIIASLGFGWVMNHMLHNNRLAAVIAGGVFLALAAVLMQRVVDPGAERVEVSPLRANEVAI